MTTSYIPVRTIRQANVRPNDFTEQYEVEDKAQDGTILNVHVEKNQVVDSSTILGYEPPKSGDDTFSLLLQIQPLLLRQLIVVSLILT